MYNEHIKGHAEEDMEIPKFRAASVVQFIAFLIMAILFIVFKILPAENIVIAFLLAAMGIFQIAVDVKCTARGVVIFGGILLLVCVMLAGIAVYCTIIMMIAADALWYIYLMALVAQVAFVGIPVGTYIKYFADCVE